MSQTVEHGDVAVPSAFRRPPSTAQMFQNAYQASPAGASEPASQPDAVAQQPLPQPVAPQQITVPPSRKANPILPQQLQPQQRMQPQVATPPSAQEQPEPQPISAPVAGVEDRALQSQMNAERTAWAQERAQWQQAVQAQAQELARAQQMQQEYNALKQNAELAKQLSNDELFSDMTTVDPADARRMIQITAQTMQGPMMAMQQELMKQQQIIAQQQQQVNAQFYQMRQRQGAEKLQAAHPDFAQLVHDPGFLQFAQQREGHLSRTREQIAWEEFNAGNPDYVINLVNQYKGTAPTVDNLRAVPPVQVAQAAVQPNSSQAVTPQYTLADLNSLIQMRQITPEEYRIRLNQLREAQQMQTP